MADHDRFRSFAERYIIERASSFRSGSEREDAWAATLDAKTIYGNIARAAKDAEPEIQVQGIGQQGIGQGSWIGQQPVAPAQGPARAPFIAISTKGTP